MRARGRGIHGRVSGAWEGIKGYLKQDTEMNGSEVSNKQITGQY